MLLKILRDNNLEYIKHNRVRLKEGSQKRLKKFSKNFFENINGTIKELAGYTIMENIENDKETFDIPYLQTI